jgi:hypothetical protein
MNVKPNVDVELAGSPALSIVVFSGGGLAKTQ